MSPAHAIDWVSRFPNQAIVKIGIAPVDANSSVKHGRPGEPDQETHAAAPEIAEAAEKEFAERVSEHAQGGDIAQPDDRLIPAHAVPGQVLNDQGRSDR